MNIAFQIASRLACAVPMFGFLAPVAAHVSLQQPVADVGSRDRDVLRGSHGQVQAPAPVRIENGWVRPTVAGQQGSGGYMKLTARENMRLIGLSSPLAGVAEVHEMKMEGEVMRMRAVKAIELPAGKTVELAGGLHLMLMDLKQPLVAGSSVPLTLLLRDSRGVESRVEARLLVSPSAPQGAATTDRKH